jgi:pyridoxamine 5'-phosphate oxidase
MSRSTNAAHETLTCMRRRFLTRSLHLSLFRVPVPVAVPRPRIHTHIHIHIHTRAGAMASIPSPKDPSKLIFAPAGHEPHAQAEQFLLSTLTRASLDPSSPTPQFNAWFTAAQHAPAVAHPETCTLSTAHIPSGRVSSRMVYLKELDARGRFVVYTNLDTSRKASDLATNPRAALVFWWEALQRQVRVEGATERLPRDESQVYFDTRVRGSRIGAWASRQSQQLDPLDPADESDDGRKRLDAWVKEAEERFDGVEHVPVPDFWGGLRIVPERVEFWQGRENRLHDRFVYERDDGEADKWTLSRLSP